MYAAAHKVSLCDWLSSRGGKPYYLTLRTQRTETLVTLETAPRAPSTIYFGWWILVAAADRLIRPTLLAVAAQIHR